MMMGDLHIEEEEFQEAVHAYGRAEQKAKELDEDDVLEDVRKKLKKAQVFLEQSKKKDYYKVWACLVSWKSILAVAGYVLPLLFGFSPSPPSPIAYGCREFDAAWPGAVALVLPCTWVASGCEMLVWEKIKGALC